MKSIGITGGVGAGKSKILDFIKANYNAEIILADDLAKELCKKGQMCYEPLVDLLSKEVLDDNLEIDKALMAQKIFDDKELLTKVNEIIHPCVKKVIKERICELKETNSVDYFFLEAALLIEDGYRAILDELWYIYTDASVRRERLKQSRNYSDEKIEAIMNSQLSEKEFRDNTDFVIDNSGDVEDSYNQIRKRLENGGE